jgi:hypothetical protein
VDPETATEIAFGLASALENSKKSDFDRLFYLGNALAALANKIEPQTAAKIAEPASRQLAAALENPQESTSNGLSRLAYELLRLKPQSETVRYPADLKTLIDVINFRTDETSLNLKRVLDEIESRRSSLKNPKESNSDRLLRLSEALLALANKMEPHATAEIAKGLASTLENPQESDSDRLLRLSEALAALANKMEPQAVAEIAKGLADTLENPRETNSDRLLHLSEALLALANKMEPQAAAEIAKGLAGTLENPRETNSDRLLRLSEALLALANKIEPQSAAEIAKGLAGALENPPETGTDRLLRLSEALLALANKIEPQGAAEIASWSPDYCNGFRVPLAIGLHAHGLAT